MKVIRIAAAAAAMLAGSPAPAQDAAPVAVPDYGQEANWLCLPGRADACSQPLPTVALNPNGYGSTGQVTPARDAKVDCFYVYPTVSQDKGLNSDLDAGQEEKGVALFQIARFGSVCRTFAPVYRQATLAALLSGLAGRGRSAEAMATAYSDVQSAWRHYLQHHNQGRPFVLVGHSQGTIHLTQLLAREIENSPASARMLSAILIGFNIEVPEGKLVGGNFQKTPLCTRVGQTGCVVTYVSYRGTNPPPQAAMFGRASRPGMTVACTNPARLSRGTAPLDSYWPTGVGLSGAPDKIRWSTTGTPPAFFVRTEGLVSAACVNRGNAGYLSVLVNADPADVRTDEIPGDVAIGGRVMPGWGLHLADVSLAQGDLIALVEAQAEAFVRR
jgi:pimeloyl-ACP methyl ester carboxylesterase